MLPGKHTRMNFFFLLLYNILVRCYAAGIHVSALWNPKAKQWVLGRKYQFQQMESHLKLNETRVWFHCASAGEFEQGRPLIEAYRKQWPGHKIILTFFSPSGYELRKNYAGADQVYYLPLDTAAAADRFISIVKPVLAVFVKYEFWYHHLSELNKRRIPVILISAIFRKDQLFFKQIGKPWRTVLRKFDHLFLQDAASADLLHSIGLKNSTLAGDTRFDRVWQIAQQPENLVRINQFKGNHKLLVAGSTWPDDEVQLDRLIQAGITGWKWVIVPHEIHDQHIHHLKSKWMPYASLYSIATDTDLASKPIILVDQVGLLSSIYSYADIAYVGGGFGKGIHNVLEAAVYGIPLLFGPNYEKFHEAKELIALGAAKGIKDSRELITFFKKFSQDDPALADVNRNYVQRNTGATARILDYLVKINSENGA